ncbi:SusC/RagA family TonB-linked outer membrane protein [Salegentibacter sp. T436]|uniref:SusC/RagA family TonB-linked outer membrane protein n=1 Tax=Salegentibacter sp. T436 TaxID=1729720 RepID=UPI00094A1F31|nr:TonB-dependent receptor [Salegentibacter sp. T436]APS40584.1 SusC/RagA family TonB-linked outer membrane protein [Salegentibacter sp. T436]
MTKDKYWKMPTSRFWVFAFLSMVGLTVSAQNLSVSGNVTSIDELPLPGVNVIVKGTSQGTQTDFDGNYNLEQVSENATLVFSYLGFITEEIQVDGRNSIDIALKPDQEALDEVVVIGYGTVKKSDLTGAVSSIKAEDLNPGANASVEQALQGRVAGVQISQKSNEPGGGLSVNIRGAGSINAGTEPLYVIDGVIVNNGSIAGSGGVGFTGNQNPRNPLNTLNPGDIESIEILKDASSTAIYGSRGSNGVVLITTKKGKAGRLKVNYDSYYGIQQAATTLDLLSPTEYQRVLNDIIDDGGGDPGQRIEEIEGDGTQWMDLVLQDAPTQNHNLSFSGATENITYYSSLNYFNQEGLVKGSGMERYNVRLNLGSNSSEKYNYGINTNISYIKDNFASTGTGINENGGALYSAINYDPTLEPYNDDGSYRLSEFVTIDNPLSILNGADARAETFRFYGNTFFEYYIAPALSAKLQLGGDVQDVRRDVFIQPYTLQGAGTGGIATIQTGRKDYVSLEGTLNYNKDFGDDNLTALLGTTYEYFQTKSFSGNARGFALPDLGTNAIGSGNPELNNLGSGRTQARFISYLARVNYSLDNKYLFTASIRADGSSRFGENNKFGYFPSGAIAWKMQEEEFLKDQKWISELKPRASLGSTGNANIGNSLVFQTFSAGGDLLFGNDFYNTIFPSRLPNQDLTWEKALQYDIGLDFGFFNNRLTGSFDYFTKETTDLLLVVPQAPNTGFAGQTQNLGGVRNSGFELGMNLNVFRKENFTWDISGNFATLENEVLEIGDRGDIYRGAQAQIPDFTIVSPGEAIDSYYGFIVDGVWQEDDNFSVTEAQVQPGDLKYRDLNGDGVINTDDRTVIGNSIPDLTWGLTNNFRFFDFTLDIVMQGVEGVERLNGNLINTLSPNNFRRNRIAEPLLNRWTPDNPTNAYPSFVNPTSQGGANALINTRTVEDASYFRLQSVRLGYELPMENFEFLNRCSLYVTGQNLLTVTDYSGVDPAANASGSNTIALDFNAYPVPRTYLLGINVEF